jgi:ABC-type glycerol-3-phosphate transport system substrate-binding protein
MKRTLGPLLAALLAGLLLLAGCGEATSSGATDEPSASSSSSPVTTAATVDPDEGLEPQTLAIVSQTAVGGKVDLDATPIADAGARSEFTAQFRRPSMDKKIAQAVAAATVPEGYTVMGAVVSIECDAPSSVTVTQAPDGWIITPDPVESPLKECFAPVTSVAVVAVPA